MAFARSSTGIFRIWFSAAASGSLTRVDDSNPNRKLVPSSLCAHHLVIGKLSSSPPRVASTSHEPSADWESSVIWARRWADAQRTASILGIVAESKPSTDSGGSYSP